MKTNILFFITTTTIFFTLTRVNGQTQQKIIDVHIHSYSEQSFGDSVKDYYGNPGAANAAEHFAQTEQAFKRFNIVKSVVSGSLVSVEEWKIRDSNRVIRGILIYRPSDDDLDSIKFEQFVKEGKIQVFGEVAPYYAGTTLNDSAWDPYLRICERYDIPVMVHTGGGDPGGTYSWSPKARLALGDPYLLEGMLVRYPKIRFCLMHSGEDWYEHTIRLMAYYPNLYSDLGVILWVEPNDQRYARNFLKYMKEAGYLNRVMYGTDQMRWPYAIAKSIKFLNSLTFLTVRDKQDLFYNNAVKFLRLDK